MKKFLLLSVIFALTGLTYGQEVNPSVSIIAENITSTTLDATFTPNDSCAYYRYVLSTEAEITQWAQMWGKTIDEMVSMWGQIDRVGIQTYNYDELIPGTEYVIYARPFNSDSTAFPLDTIHVRTLSMGGTSLSTIEVVVSEITTTSAKLTVTPNSETAKFYDGLVTKELFDEIGLDSAAKILYSIPTNLHYEAYDWTWQGLESNTEYKAIAFGQNSNDEWGDTTVVDFTTLASSSVNQIENDNFKIYPQPNNGLFTIESDKITGKTIKIFDMNGRLVHQEPWIRNRQEISVGHLDSGTYIIQTESGKNAGRIIIKK